MDLSKLKSELSEFQALLYSSEEEAATFLQGKHKEGYFSGRSYVVREGRRMDRENRRQMSAKATILGEVMRLGTLLMPGDPTVEAARENSNRTRLAMMNPPPEDKLVWQNQTIAGVLCRVYKKANCSQDNLPVLMYIHGGGWVQCGLDSHHGTCGELVARSAVPMVLISVEYSLAPEFKYPAPLNDCFSVYQYLREKASEFGGDPTRVAVGGDSAGGNLTAAITVRCLEKMVPPPDFQLLIYPSVHMEANLSSRVEFVESEILLSSARLKWFRRHYIGENEDQYFERCDEHEASPGLWTGDWSKKPPAMVVTAGFDPLRDEAEFYAQRLEAAGVPVERYEVSQSVHAFTLLTKVLPEADEAFDRMAKYITDRWQ